MCRRNDVVEKKCFSVNKKEKSVCVRNGIKNVRPVFCRKGSRFSFMHFFRHSDHVTFLPYSDTKKVYSPMYVCVRIMHLYMYVCLCIYKDIHRDRKEYNEKDRGNTDTTQHTNIQDKTS